jgi:GT2 family glycosyltransferase
LDEAEELDAKLRLSDAVSSDPKAVLHLPKVLVHLPDRPSGMTRGATPAVLQALSDHATRRGLEVAWATESGRLRPRYQPAEPQPLVSIIIPTRDQAALLRTCIDSILKRTEYQAYEIIIVDNRSQEAETLHLFNELARDQRVRVLAYPHPFNYSAINNFAVRHARGSLLALLNNDVEVVAREWLSDMVAHASRPEIGCVGAKLLYPDGTVQHGGILLGVAGLAGHAHRHAPGTAPGYLERLQWVLNVSAVTAACLVVRRSVFDEVGGLDEVGLGTAFNDVDLCLKIRAAGYWNLWSPNAILIHHESKSRGYERTPAKRARLAAEEDVMRRRWGRILLEDPFYSPHLARANEAFRIRQV